jgi:hypothetical protein
MKPVSLQAVVDEMDDWYSYRNDALKRIAADFLEAEEIDFVVDDRFENAT